MKFKRRRHYFFKFTSLVIVVIGLKIILIHYDNCDNISVKNQFDNFSVENQFDNLSIRKPFNPLTYHLEGDITKYLRKPFNHLSIRKRYNPLNYPLEGDITKYINQIRTGNTPDIPPINTYDYPFILSNNSKCLDSTGNLDKIKLLILVKSALTHRHNRRAIRQTWGQENRFGNTKIRVAFLLGTQPQDNLLQLTINREFDKYGDLIQSDFIDTYYNNTFKTMQGLRWVVDKCPLAKFIFFVDDDFYISMKNLLRFIRDHEDDNYLYVGKVSKFLYPNRGETSKWFISEKDYPYSTYPRFILAGAFLLTYEALLQLFYGSLYTRHYVYDDVYLGLIAGKVGISLSHHKYFWAKRNVKYVRLGYKNVIAAHGFHDPEFLIRMWKEQVKLHNA